MGKYKENIKYNVLSIRVTDEEKAAIDAIRRATKSSVTAVMREAMRQYTSCSDGALEQCSLR